jgi:hypothetical protein
MSFKTRQKIALKAIQTMKKKYGAGVFSKIGKKAAKMRKRNAG